MAGGGLAILFGLVIPPVGQVLAWAAWPFAFYTIRIVEVMEHHKVIIAHHDTVVEPDDHVIIFVVNKRLVPKVEKLFQVGLGFF